MMSAYDVVLFQGDFITDCGRFRDNEGTPNDLGALGQGYPLMAAVHLQSAMPDAGLRFFNRCISGQRIVDLYARIKADFINLQPSLISILVGVSDTWREFPRKNGVPVPKYARIFRELLNEIRMELPEVKLVLCEPFVLKCGVVTNEWIEEMNQRLAIVAKLALEFGATFIPFLSMFDEAVKKAPAAYQAGDGVHPTAAGHMLMAKKWIQLVKGCRS